MTLRELINNPDVDLDCELRLYVPTSDDYDEVAKLVYEHTDAEAIMFNLGEVV